MTLSSVTSGSMVVAATEKFSDQLARIMEKGLSLEFWLGDPLRILAIIVCAFIIRGILGLIIRKITDSVARGTKARIISRQSSPDSEQQAASDLWMSDTAISNARQAQRAHTVGSVLKSISSIVVWAIAIVMIISELGFNIAPVIASAGIAGVALSFGAQSLVKDYLSGIFIVAEDQLGIGDWVDLGEAAGTVESVGLRVTAVRDNNGTLWHVRNGEILRVGNSSQGWAKTNINLPIPYESDIKKISAYLLEAARKTLSAPDVARNIMGEPEILGIESITGEALTLRISVKTAPSAQWHVARVLRAGLKDALDHYGASIPLQNQSVIRHWQDKPIDKATKN